MGKLCQCLCLKMSFNAYFDFKPAVSMIKYHLLRTYILFPQKIGVITQSLRKYPLQLKVSDIYVTSRYDVTAHVAIIFIPLMSNSLSGHMAYVM